MNIIGFLAFFLFFVYSTVSANASGSCDPTAIVDILVAVDTSSAFCSMIPGISARLTSLLLQGNLNGRIGLVSFGGDQSKLILPFTNLSTYTIDQTFPQTFSHLQCSGEKTDISINVLQTVLDVKFVENLEPNCETSDQCVLEWKAGAQKIILLYTDGPSDTRLYNIQYGTSTSKISSVSKLVTESQVSVFAMIQGTEALLGDYASNVYNNGVLDSAKTCDTLTQNNFASSIEYSVLKDGGFFGVFDCNLWVLGSVSFPLSSLACPLPNGSPGASNKNLEEAYATLLPTTESNGEESSSSESPLTIPSNPTLYTATQSLRNQAEAIVSSTTLNSNYNSYTTPITSFPNSSTNVGPLSGSSTSPPSSSTSASKIIASIITPCAFLICGMFALVMYRKKAIKEPVEEEAAATENLKRQRFSAIYFGKHSSSYDNLINDIRPLSYTVETPFEFADSSNDNDTTTPSTPLSVVVAKDEPIGSDITETVFEDLDDK